MPANEYQFLTEWRVAAPREVLFEILKEGKDYPVWWPEVYLDARYEPSGRADGIGDKVHLLTKGWLPYKLRWTAESVRRDFPTEIEIRATGDFNGRGIWHFEPRGTDEGETCVTFDWRLRADKPLLRWLSPLLKPIFKWNHRWAMKTGLPRLQAEAQRRMQQANESRSERATA
ncbi:MAG TPA: SRPBCC family protein [Blastocatellia bacterium]|nr:SRPBCC family protein [Blastocatellia bacterium]